MFAAVIAIAMNSFAFGSTPYGISGPIQYDNLSIYFLHGTSADGPVPLTLEEALVRGTARVFETGNVNELTIENLGNEEVFVQAGDIVKGGKQDRVLTVSLLLKPRSGRVPIASYCVEEGRWSARGKEDVRHFASADAAMPSRAARIAMHAPTPARSLGSLSAQGLPATEPSRQAEVWRNVTRVQEKLSSSVGAPVASPESQSSLQLSLENQKLKDMQDKYVEALQAGGERHADIVGHVIAVNGKLSSADLYPSNGLFRKMWRKQLVAAATEAIGERNGSFGGVPSVDAVAAFLAEAERGRSREYDLVADVQQETRDARRAYFVESRRPSGQWLHRSYLAK